MLNFILFDTFKKFTDAGGSVALSGTNLMAGRPYTLSPSVGNFVQQVEPLTK